VLGVGGGDDGWVTRCPGWRGRCGGRRVLLWSTRYSLRRWELQRTACARIRVVRVGGGGGGWWCWLGSDELRQKRRGRQKKARASCWKAGADGISSEGRCERVKREPSRQESANAGRTAERSGGRHVCAGPHPREGVCLSEFRSDSACVATAWKASGRAGGDSRGKRARVRGDQPGTGDGGQSDGRGDKRAAARRAGSQWPAAVLAVRWRCGGGAGGAVELHLLRQDGSDRRCRRSCPFLLLLTDAGRRRRVRRSSASIAPLVSVCGGRGRRSGRVSGNGRTEKSGDWRRCRTGGGGSAGRCRGRSRLTMQ